MKKLYLVFITLLSVLAVQAQVDRSKMPEPGPAPKINLKEPQSFKLKNGVNVLVVENHKLPRVSIQLTIDNPPILEGNKAGVSSITGSLMGNGSKNIPKDVFNEEIDFLGARMSFGSQGAYASSLSKYFPRMIELMADAAINPNFTQEQFNQEKEKIVTALKTQEKDVAAIASRVQLALSYGKDHPYGEFTTEATVNNITLADTERFYRNYFVPANAYLIVIGDVEFKDVQKIVKEHFTPWTKAVPPSFSFSTPSNVQYTQINFVDMPNAVQSEISVQNMVNLKRKDEDYIAALLANQVLGGASESRLNLNLREDKGYTYGSYSSIGSDKYASSTFSATAKVRNIVTDSSVVEILKEIELINKEPISEKELVRAKAKYAGSFIMNLENPQTIAGYALNIEMEDLPKDFYKTFLEKLEKVSKTDVENAAKKYFSATNARVVVIGKGSEILDNLEKATINGSKIPVSFFNKTAEKTEKPDYSAAIPERLTSTSIIERYIKAIGGKAALEKLESYHMVASAEMQGRKLEMEMKKTSKGQFMQDIKTGGDSMSKQVLDGDRGYMIAQGQRKDFSAEEISKVKEESAPFPELNYLTAGDVSLEGTEAIGDKKAYVVQIRDNKTAFYDMETGLKLQEVNTMEMQGKQVQQTFLFDDYKEVSGILFPFKLTQRMGTQNIDFIFSDIKVNTGVSDSDFE
ncbi:MAG: putative Zn-dependent peptidase [Maribacter sp.]|jgi:predicted Zn-dependent peptidase